MASKCKKLKDKGMPKSKKKKKDKDPVDEPVDIDASY